MNKITITFNKPKQGKITIILDKKSITMDYKDYENLIVPRISKKTTSEDFNKNIRKNIENYFASLK